MKSNQLAVAYGRDARALAVRLLEAAGIASELSPSLRVMVKPNLVTAAEASSGATTHPQLAEGK
jgi:uncharacterized protein (DUF362 family)